jgi:hypothetical protein
VAVRYLSQLAFGEGGTPLRGTVRNTRNPRLYSESAQEYPHRKAQLAVQCHPRQYGYHGICSECEGKPGSSTGGILVGIRLIHLGMLYVNVICSRI